MGLTDFQNGFALGLSSGGAVTLGGGGIDQVQSDYAQYDSTAVDFIKNKEFYWEPATKFDIMNQTISLETWPYATELLGTIIPIENFPILILEQEIYTFTLQHHDGEYLDVPLKFYEIDGDLVAGNVNLIYDEENVDCPDVPYCFIFTSFDDGDYLGLGIFFTTEDVTSGECQFKLKCNLENPITIEPLQTVTVESETEGMIMKEPNEVPSYILQEDTEIEVFLDNKSKYKGLLKKATMEDMPSYYSYLYLGNLDLVFQIIGEDAKEGWIYTPSYEDYGVLLFMGAVLIVSPELTLGVHTYQINLNKGTRIQKLATKYIDYDFSTIQNVGKKGSGEFSVILNNYDNHEVIDSYDVNEASGAFSIAMGNHTQAYGNNSHSEGEDTLAYGDESHSEGYNTRALGDQSHAEGYGYYNTCDSIVGGGSLISDSTNQVRYNGNQIGYIAPYIDQYVYLSNSYPNDIFDLLHKDEIRISNAVYNPTLNYTVVTFSDNINYYYEDLLPENIGIYVHASGAEGDYSHTEGYAGLAKGTASHSEGYRTKALKEYSHTEGYQTQALGNSSHAEGSQTKAIGPTSHAEGEITHAIGNSSHAEGCYSSAIGHYSHAEGENSVLNTIYPLNATGAKPATATDSDGDSKLIMLDNSSIDYYTSYIGTTFYIYPEYLEITPNQINKFQANCKIATLTSVTSSDEGPKLKFSFKQGSNFGPTYRYYLYLFPGASGKGSHIEGYHNIARGDYSHAEGSSNETRGNYSHAEGTNTITQGSASHAEGCYTQALGTYSHAEGYQTVARGGTQHVQGKYNIIDNEGEYAHIVGNGSGTSKRSNAHTLDWEGNAWFQGKVYIGGTSKETAKELSTMPAGLKQGDVNFGLNTIAGGNYSIAMGGTEYYTNRLTKMKLTSNTTFTDSIPSNYETIYKYLKNRYFVVEDEESTTYYYTTDVALDEAGENVIFTFEPAYYGTINNTYDLYFKSGASNAFTFAQGYDATANGLAAHAEGYSTTAAGTGSHSEGFETSALGEYAHAEGNQTKATGNMAHAEGFETYASGMGAHAEGWETEATGAYQHVFGMFNKPDEITESNPYGEHVIIVGNGHNADTPVYKNAYTLDWNGNGVYSGSVNAPEIKGMKAIVGDMTIINTDTEEIIIESLLAKIQDLETRLSALEGN